MHIVKQVQPSPYIKLETARSRIAFSALPTWIVARSNG
jgi:hypothetical protein